MNTLAAKSASLVLSLLFCVGLAGASLFAADAPPSDPEACLKEARALVEQGKHEEAFQKFIWCYDHGVEANPKFARTRDTRVTLFMVSLGKKYPPARAALVERRDALAKQVKAEPAKADKAVLQQLAYLDLGVSNDVAILETLAALAGNKPGHRAYGGVVQERLVEGKHYREAASVEDVEEAVAMLEKTARNVEKMRQAGRLDETAIAKLKGLALKAAPGVEMYAGFGDLKHAKQLADLLLEISDDAEVRQKLADRLRRAGAEELAAKYGAAKK